MQYICNMIFKAQAANTFAAIVSMYSNKLNLKTEFLLQVTYKQTKQGGNRI